MCPIMLKAFYKHSRKITNEVVIKADSFSFGLSMLEMGNLLNLKRIRLN